MSHVYSEPLRRGRCPRTIPTCRTFAGSSTATRCGREHEGIPIVEGVAIDLPTVQTAPWPRMGVDGAFVHSHARGDYCSIYVLDLPPGGSTTRVHHLYEAIYFVLDGQGSTVVEGPDGDKRSFEWGKGRCSACP